MRLIAFTPALSRETPAHKGHFHRPRDGMRQTRPAQPGLLPSGFFNARKTLLPAR